MVKVLKQLFRLATSSCLCENYVVGAEDPPEKHLSEHFVNAVKALLVLMKKFSLLLFIEIWIAVVQTFEQLVVAMAHDSLIRSPELVALMIKPRPLTEDGQFPCEIALQPSLGSSLHHHAKQSHSKSLLGLHFCFHIRRHGASDGDLPGQEHWVVRTVGLPVG
jgi:hypothetical protein